RKADDDRGEIEDRRLRERMQVTAVPRDEGEVGAAGAEHGAEERERAGGGAGEGPAGGAGCPGCRERSEIVGRFAPDEADGHGEHAERDEEADGGGAVAESGVR